MNLKKIFMLGAMALISTSFVANSMENKQEQDSNDTMNQSLNMQKIYKNPRLGQLRDEESKLEADARKIENKLLEAKKSVGEWIKSLDINGKTIEGTHLPNILSSMESFNAIASTLPKVMSQYVHPLYQLFFDYNESATKGFFGNTTNKNKEQVFFAEKLSGTGKTAIKTLDVTFKNIEEACDNTIQIMQDLKDFSRALRDAAGEGGIVSKFSSVKKYTLQQQQNTLKIRSIRDEINSIIEHEGEQLLDPTQDVMKKFEGKFSINKPNN